MKLFCVTPHRRRLSEIEEPAEIELIGRHWAHLWGVVLGRFRGSDDPSFEV